MVSASGGTPPTSRNARKQIGHAAIVAAALCAGCVGQIAAPPGGSGAPTGAAGPINPGRVVAHRLNNVEYDNTIRDLTGVAMRPSSDLGFPDDAYVEGFDNHADSLTAPP